MSTKYKLLAATLMLGLGIAGTSMAADETQTRTAEEIRAEHQAATAGMTVEERNRYREEQRATMTVEERNAMRAANGNNAGKGNGVRARDGSGSGAQRRSGGARGAGAGQGGNR